MSSTFLLVGAKIIVSLGKSSIVVILLLRNDNFSSSADPVLMLFNKSINDLSFCLNIFVNSIFLRLPSVKQLALKKYAPSG